MKNEITKKVEKCYIRTPGGYIKGTSCRSYSSLWQTIFIYSHLNDFMNLQYLSFEVSDMKLQLFKEILKLGFIYLTMSTSKTKVIQFAAELVKFKR